MLSFCLKCVKKIQKVWIQIQKASEINNGKTIILSKCAICGSKTSRFIKKREASRTLSNLGLKTPLSKVPLLGDILFWT